MAAGDRRESRQEVRNITKAAAARRLLTLVFHGMRDGQIRCLSAPDADPPHAPRPRPGHAKG